MCSLGGGKNQAQSFYFFTEVVTEVGGQLPKLVVTDPK